MTKGSAIHIKIQEISVHKVAQRLQFSFAAPNSCGNTSENSSSTQNAKK